MKIAIDARFYGITGIGRYLSNLISNVEKIDAPYEFDIFLKKSNVDAYLPKNERFRKKVIDAPWYSFKEQLLLPFELYKGRYDLVHFPHLNIPVLYLKPYVVTIHDLIMHGASKGATTRFTPYFYFKKVVYKAVVWWAVKRAKHIVVPTHTVKEEIKAAFNLPDAKITVTYEAVDDVFFEYAQKIKQDPQAVGTVLNHYAINRPYIVYLSSFYEHKNHKTLLDAFAKLLTEGFTIDGEKPMLVLIGKQDVFAERIFSYIAKMQLQDHVILPGKFAENGYVPDEEAVALVAGASLFVCPSKKEGFGINFLEAMALGVPVVLSNASCIPEVGGDAAEYFDPDSVDEIVEKIQKVIADAALRKLLIQKGHARVLEFSWEKMAEQTIHVYESCILAI